MKNQPFTALLTAIALPAVFFLWANPRSARAEELTPSQLEAIRTQIDTLTKTLEEITAQKNTSLTDIFLQAAGSASAAKSFYLDCMQEVNFTRIGERESEFRDWKEGYETYLDDSDVAQLLQIQLRYMAISTQAARTEDLAEVFPLLTRYIDNITSMSEIPTPIRARREFTDRRDWDKEREKGRPPIVGNTGMAPVEQPRAIDRTVFAMRYNIGEELQKVANSWELDYLNVAGMYDKTVLPYLRKENPEQVLAAWQKRIDQEGRMAALLGEGPQEIFQRLTLPGLQWEMLKDEFAVASKPHAVAKMLAHVDAHKTTHPKAPAWLNEIIPLVFGEPSAETPGTTTAPASPSE